MSVGAGAECEGSLGGADLNRDPGGLSVCIHIVLCLSECTCVSSSQFWRHVHIDMYVAGLCAWLVSACARVPFCKHLHIPCAYSCMRMCLTAGPAE